MEALDEDQRAQEAREGKQMIYEREHSIIVFCREDSSYAIWWGCLCDRKFLHRDFVASENCRPIGSTVLVEWVDE